MGYRERLPLVLLRGNRSGVVAVFGCLTLCAVLACSEPPPSTDPDPYRPPNIILVLADDLGWSDLRVYDPASAIPTPNIDRLAAAGIRFTDAHSPASVCTPSRYGILTGRYAWRTRLETRVLRYFDPPLIEDGRLTLPELLRRRGYATAAVGKWHLGLNVPSKGGDGFARLVNRDLPPDPDFTAAIQGGPLDRGFDTYFGAQLARVRGFVRDRHFVATPIRGPADRRFQVAGWNESEKGPRQLAEALKMIDRFQTEDPKRPFFLYFASQAPHTPYLPATEIAGVPVAGTSGVGPRGDLVVELDVMLGQLMKRLDELEVAGETLVILTSDNGGESGSGIAGGESRNPESARAWRGQKGAIWEGGHRVPLIARWGDGTASGSVIPPGSTNRQLIGLQDLMATVAHLLEEPLPSDAAEDSESFLPALLGRRDVSPDRVHLMHHSSRGRFAIRRGDWKLILAGPKHRGRKGKPQTGPQLYNLAEDPSEVDNLYQQHPEIVAELTSLLERDRQAGHSASRLQ